VGSATDVSGFSIELSVSAGSGITFTSADTNTSAPYIFGTLQAPPLVFDSFPNHSFTASDSSQSPPFVVTLNPGDTVGLEHVSYFVAPGTRGGAITVSIVSGANTGVFDVDGDPITTPPVTFTDGTITVTGSTAPVPEPSS
jgi:hypothetical protein